jgi:uncharacterized protein (TIGR03437 family)
MKKGWIALAAGAAPLLLWAFSMGPDPGVSGVPGEAGTCASSGCHTGATVGSSMTISAAGGPTFQPGVAKTITVTITDTSARYGFQATGRLSSNAKSQAGPITTTDSNLLVLCSSLDLLDQQTKPAAGCPASQPLEYVSHRSPRPTGTFTFTFTPRADVTENIVIYAAGNAANGDGSRLGDRIHTARLTLTPAAAPNRPSISAGGAITAGNFGGGGTVAPQGWMEIYGTNLAPSTADWTSAIASGNAPTTLNGVEVTIGGRAAFLSFVSPGQVNVQVPDGVGTGPTVMTVRNANGTSDNYTINVAPVVPAFLAPPVAPFKTATRQFVAAFFPESTGAGPFAGNPSESQLFRSARPNDRLILYAVGLGGVTPPQQAGRIVSGPTALNSISLNFGGTPVALEYAGHAPGFVGLYQINAVVPNLPPGEYAIGGMVNGTPIPAGLFINLK